MGTLTLKQMKDAICNSPPITHSTKNVDIKIIDIRGELRTNKNGNQYTAVLIDYENSIGQVKTKTLMGFEFEVSDLLTWVEVGDIINVTIVQNHATGYATWKDFRRADG